MIGPDTSRVVGQHEAHGWKVDGDDNRLYLAPCGWMISVVAIVESDGDPHIDFELTNHDGTALYATADRPSMYELCGRYWPIIALQLADPLPNLNAAQPYVLRAKSTAPCSVNVIQLYCPHEQN